MGVILAILIGLSALKAITGHRKEFFREAGSGYNVNSFTLAINIMVTLEHSAQTVIAALFSLWLRSSYASWTNFFVHFLGLSWIATSWALLFPLIIPAENVFTVAGFYYVLFSLLFSGGVAPVLYSSKLIKVKLVIVCRVLGVQMVSHVSLIFLRPQIFTHKGGGASSRASCRQPGSLSKAFQLQSLASCLFRAGLRIWARAFKEKP